MMGEERLKPETVYVLGAGFSYEAGVPLQSQILERIRDLDPLSAPSLLSEIFAECQGRSIAFISRIFEQVPNPRLEDIFTLIDQSVQHRNYCVGYNWQEIEVIRRALLNAIVHLFHSGESAIPPDKNKLYKEIAAFLIERRVKAGQKNHPFSVISLNWDCLLENAIYWCLDQYAITGVDVDYCCYTTPLQGLHGEKTEHVPSIQQKAVGLYNLKVMKLHGSINCVICPNCNRLYAGLHAPIEWMEEYLANKTCPRCSKVMSLSPEGDAIGPILEPLLISPTFLKELNNTHIQMIWHNAYVDLCEAKEVVFIGYSLPEADYHLRTLLKRAIRRGTKITTVLIDQDNPTAGCPPHIKDKYAASRYRAFFGSEPTITIRPDGTSGYFRSQIGARTYENRLESVRQMLAPGQATPTEKNELGGEGSGESPVARQNGLPGRGPLV